MHIFISIITTIVLFIPAHLGEIIFGVLEEFADDWIDKKREERKHHRQARLEH